VGDDFLDLMVNDRDNSILWDKTFHFNLFYFI
jgi:hypothetical protein